LPRLAVLFVLSAASSPCPDLNLIHYIILLATKRKGRLKSHFGFQTTFFFA